LCNVSGKIKAKSQDYVKPHTNEYAHFIILFIENLSVQHIGYLWEIQKERDHWEDQDVGGWTILKWILER
jgi:hypothetical protein